MSELTDNDILFSRIDTLETTIKDMSVELRELKDAINKLVGTCDRMDSHISFVEATYDTLKKPLDFVKEKVNYLTN